jgi:hypothetical protein
MGDAFGKAVMPGPEYVPRCESVLLVVPHEHANSMLDHWDGGFKEKNQELSNGQAEE